MDGIGPLGADVRQRQLASVSDSDRGSPAWVILGGARWADGLWRCMSCGLVVVLFFSTIDALYKENEKVFGLYEHVRVVV